MSVTYNKSTASVEFDKLSVIRRQNWIVISGCKLFSASYLALLYFGISGYRK